MRSAAPKTYISKRMLERYSEQRSEKVKAKSNPIPTNKASAPQVPAKPFSEDNRGTNLAVIEESKEELKETNANVEATVKKGFFSSIASFFSGSSKKGAKPQAAAQENQSASATSQQNRDDEIDRNLSAEELDSDELDGELNLSDEDNGGSVRANLRRRTDTATKAKREKINVEFDTNVFKIALDCLQ